MHKTNTTCFETQRSGSARLFGRSLLVPFPLKTSLSASNRLPARLRSYTFGHVFGRKSPNPRDPATSASDNANLLNNLWHQQQSTSTGSADLSALNSLYSPMIELDATNPFDSMSGYSSSNGFNTYADFDAIFPPDMPNKALPMTQIDVVSRTPTNIESGMNMKPSSSVDRKLGANRALVGFGEPNHRPRYLQSNSYRSNAAKAKQMLHSGTPLTSNLFRISTPHMPHSSAGSAASTVYHLASGSKSLPMLAVSPVIRLLDGEQHVLVKSPISNQPNGQLLVLKSRRPAKGRDLPVALSLTSSATDDLQKWINNQAIEQQFRMLKPDTIKMQSSNHRVTAEPKWPITKNKVSLPATFNGDIITLEDIENALRSGVMAEAFKVESSGGNKAGTTPDHLITSKFSKPTEIDSQFSKQVMSAISFDHHHHHHHHGHHHDAPIVRGQVFDEQIKPNPVSSWSEQVKDRANAAETQTEGSPFTSNTNSNLQVVMPMASANDDRWRPVQVNGPWIRRNQKMSKALVTGAANELQVKMKEKSRIKLKQSDVRSVSSSQTSSVYDQAISQQKETDEQMKETNEELAKQEQEKERPESVSMDRSLQQKETDTSSDEQQEQIDYGFEAEAEQQQSKMDREKESNLKQSKEAPDRPVQQKEEQQKIELSVGAKGRSKKSETKKASLRRPLFGGRKPMKGSSLGDVIDKNARLSSEKEKSAAEEGSYFKQVITPSNAKQYELFTSRPMKEVQMEDQDWVDGKQSAAGRKMKKNDKQLQSTSTDDVTTQGSSTTDNSEEEEEETSEDSRETGAATTASTARVDLSGEPIELVTVDDLTDNEPETSSAGHEAQPEAGKYKGDSDDTYDNDKQDATTVASERVDDGDEPTEEALGERAEESFRSEQRSRLAATTESSLIRSDVQTPSLSLSTSSQPLYTNYDENNYYNGRECIFRSN